MKNAYFADLLLIYVVGAQLCPSPSHVSRFYHSLEHSLTLCGFTSTKGYLNAPLALREELERQLRVPAALFDRMYIQSNGFAGHSLWLDNDDEVKCYSK